MATGPSTRTIRWRGRWSRRSRGVSRQHSKCVYGLDDCASRLSGEHVISKAALKRSEEHTSELQSLMRISYAVFCWKKKNKKEKTINRKMRTTTINIVEDK